MQFKLRKNAPNNSIFVVREYTPIDWQLTRKFAWLPKRLWRYDDRRSVNIGARDEYRVFEPTASFVWLEDYHQVSGKEKNRRYLKFLEQRTNTTHRFAVDYRWLVEHLL